ncbi:MAG: hypothetical protein ACLP2Y_09715 [Limisphaerales bacterium]
MKVKNLITIGCLLFSAAACHSQEVQVTFKIVDDFGKPVEGATAGIATFERTKIELGGGFGEDIWKNIKAKTDKSGMATIKGNSPRADVAYGVDPMPGYYWTEGGRCWFKSVQNGEWQPSNPTMELVLKPIVNPMPMYHGIVSDKKIPVEGKPVGFDLTADDWVTPYGNGATADFVFQLDAAPEKTITNWWGNQPRPRLLRDDKLTVSFSNDGDGIQSVLVPKEGRSDLRLPRQAPLDGYKPELIKHDYDEITGKQKENTLVQHHSDYQEDGNYFFRVRTKKDAQGNIVSALYGEIYGDFNAAHGGGITSKMSFSYHLNPKPNDTNMEFDSTHDFKKP